MLHNEVGVHHLRAEASLECHYTSDVEQCDVTVAREMRLLALYHLCLALYSAKGKRASLTRGNRVLRRLRAEVRG